MMYLRQVFMWIVQLLVCGCAAVAVHAQTALPSPASLPQALATALQRGQPLVVMVSLEGCPFCKMVRESHLSPMRIREGLAVVQVDMRNKTLVTNLDGQSMTQDALIRQWGVTVAPTVLFFGPDGVEVAERLVGGYIPDFYGAYLSDRLQAASSALQLSHKKGR